MTEKQYDVIDKEEPRGQSVTWEGIPCTARTCVTRLNRLTEENEQLKQRNDKQYNQLKQLWELIEDEDYNTLRSMLNQRETDEKLLQKEWGTYSD